MPGGLPLSALMVVTPAVAGATLAWRDAGWRGVRVLFGRFRVGLRRGSAWWWCLSAVALPVVLIVAHTSVFVAPGGDALDRLPPPQVLASASLLFLGAAAIEEVGWTAYATADAVALFGQLGAGIVLGTVWAGWHVIPWLQMGHPVGWVAAQSVFTVLLRTLQLLIYGRTAGSALAATLLHATANLALLPGMRSRYDPMLASVGLLVVVFSVGVVVSRDGSSGESVGRPARTR